MLFAEGKTLSLPNTEQNLLNIIYGFIRTSCSLNGTKTQ